MVLSRRIAGGMALPALLACLLACGCSQKSSKDGSPKEPQEGQAKNDLQQLGLMYHSYKDSNLNPPADAKELAQWAQRGGLPGAALIQQTSGPGGGGKYVIYFGAKIPQDFPAGMDKTVLGYESKVPGEGGVVLMGDGVAKTMTAAEFQAAAKPKIAK